MFDVFPLALILAMDNMHAIEPPSFLFPSQTIYSMSVSGGGGPEVFTSPGGYVDDLAYDHPTTTLYWTMFESGQIVSVDVNVDDKVPEVLLSGLDKPRAITIDQDHR